MSRLEDETSEETWESQVAGTTFVEVRDYDGRRRSVSAKGVGKRLRFTTADRLRYQEQIRDPKGDPFRNGTLLRVDANQQDDEATASTDALSDADLRAVFELDMDDFREYVSSLGQINIRRLKAMCEDAQATVNQAGFIDELIEERFKIGGDTPTYRELKSGPVVPT